MLILSLNQDNFFQKEPVDLFQSQVCYIERRFVDSLDGREKVSFEIRWNIKILLIFSGVTQLISEVLGLTDKYVNI